jgi:RNA polymerase sigma factor (sigma-70 family)
VGTQGETLSWGAGTALGRLEVLLAGFSDRPELNGSHEAWILVTLPRALAYARSLLRDPALAEDVTHDCYVRLLAKAGTYDLPRDGTKLLYKAITNACIDKNYRDRRMVSLEAEAVGESAGAPPLPDNRADDPHELAAHRELEDAVALELLGLTVAQRGALELRSLGYSLEEIAESLGTSASNAGVLVHRARKILAGRLARFLEEAPDESA